MCGLFAYVNGQIVPFCEARVSIADRGLLYGDGVFETIRVVGRKCIRLDKHLARLASGAGVLGIGDLPDNRTLINAILSVIDANNLSDARVRLTVTRGVASGVGLLSEVRSAPTVAITAVDLPRDEPKPARVVVSRVARRDERSPLSSIKSLNYLPNILALQEARRLGADDAILLNMKGSVAEATVGNLFLVIGSKLITPSLDQGVLPGTVRQAVLELAPRLGLEVVERPVECEELTQAEEVFYTNAIQLIRSVCEVDGVLVGSGECRVARALRNALESSG